MYSHPHQYLYNTVHLLIHKTYMVRLSLKRCLGFFNLRLFFCVCECWIYLSVSHFGRGSAGPTHRGALRPLHRRDRPKRMVQRRRAASTGNTQLYKLQSCLLSPKLSLKYTRCPFLSIVYAINSNNVEKKRIRPTFKALLHPWRGEKFGRWRNKQSVCSREGS